MDYDYIKPFIESAISIVRDVVNAKVKRKSIYVTTGKQIKFTSGVIIDISGDVEGRIIFDFSKETISKFAEKMIGWNLGVEKVKEYLQDKKFIESTIGELGNLISGKAVSILGESQYDCTIHPPIIFTNPKNAEQEKKIYAIIEFESYFGNFDICLINKDEEYVKNLSLLFYKIDNAFSQYIVHAYLPRGFYVYTADNPDEIKSILNKTNVDFLIGNFDVSKKEDKNFLSSIRQSNVTKNIKIAIYTNNNINDSKLINEMKSLQINDFISKNASETSVIEQINDFMKKNEVSRGERRKHIRVNINPEEKYIISFYHEEQLGKIFIIPGLIIDLSLGAIYFKISNKYTKYLALRQKIDQIALNINNNKIIINGIVFFKKKNIIGVKLVFTPEKSLKLLCDVIFERTNKNIQVRVN